MADSLLESECRLQVSVPWLAQLIEGSITIFLWQVDPQVFVFFLKG
jgi:hypothetical protein